MIVVEYDVELKLETIWGSPAKVLQILKSWILSQRWIGNIIGKHHELVVKDQFLLSDAPNHLIIGFLLELFTERKLQFNYFIPLEFSRKRMNSLEYPIILKCTNGPLFIGPAEIDNLFFELILKNFVKTNEFLTLNLNLIQFQEFSPEVANFNTLISKKSLGRGDTTNSLYETEWLNGSRLVFKISRILSPNPEVKMLKLLYKKGFHHIPQPLGSLSVKIADKSYPLVLILKYIEAAGDGGIIFWNDLNTQLKNWKISNALETKQLNNTLERLGQIVADLHYYSSQINDDLFKPEPIYKNDIKKWKNNMRKMLKFIQDHFKMEHFSDIGLQPLLQSFEKCFNRFLTNPHWQLLEGSLKIKIHQDLHLAQMLTTKSSDGISYFILDFEGDPLLSPEDKFQKDPIFRDLAGVFNAFHYITFNALRDIFHRKERLTAEKFASLYLGTIEPAINSSSFSNFGLKLIEFAKNWKKYNQNIFYRNYIKQLKKHDFDFQMNLDNIIHLQYLLNIFRAERFIKELHYETLFRRLNIFIPLVGFLDIFTKDGT